MRDRLLGVTQTCMQRGRKGAVYFVTSEKNIQAVKTASAFGVIGAGINSLAEFVNLGLALITLPRVPTAWIVLVGMVAVFWVADYADENTEDWRKLVEETTGEEAADD